MIRTDLTYEEALALPNPKSIWIDGNRVVVDTTPDTSLPVRSNNKVNVKDYGAKGNGTTATAAFKEATAYTKYIGGGVISIPQGTYKITEPIIIDFPGVYIEGDGWGSVITRNTDFGDTFHFTGNDVTGAILNDVGLSNLCITSTGLTTGGAHIHTSGVNRGKFSKVYMKDGFIGWDLDGLTASYLDKIYVVFSKNYGGVKDGRRYMQFGEAASTYAHPHSGDVFVTDFNLRGNTTNQEIVEYGCNILNGDGIWFENGHIGNASLANIQFDGSTVDNLNLVFFTNVMTDEGNGYGVYFKGSTPDIYRHIKFSNCMFKGAATGTYGIATAANCPAIYTQFENCSIVEFKYDGVSLLSPLARSWKFNNCTVNGNAQDIGTISAGYHLASGVQDITISGGSAGRNSTGVGIGLTYYGVRFAGGSSNVRVNGVDLTGNASQSVLGGATAIFNNCLIQDSTTIASASTLTLRPSSDFFHISGTTNITAISSTRKGRIVTLVFQDSLTVVEGPGLILNGNFVSQTNSVLRLVYDGTNWIKI